MPEAVAQILPLVVAGVVVLFLYLRARRVPDWGNPADMVTLDRDADGALVVPVAEVWHRRVLLSTRNGISPRFWITPAGLRFKVFKTSERRFADFTRVHAARSAFLGTRLIFEGHRESLHVKLRKVSTARAVLRALPPDAPLSPAAAALRGDQPVAT